MFEIMHLSDSNDTDELIPKTTVVAAAAARAQLKQIKSKTRRQANEIAPKSLATNVQTAPVQTASAVYEITHLSSDSNDTEMTTAYSDAGFASGTSAASVSPQQFYTTESHTSVAVSAANAAGAQRAPIKGTKPRRRNVAIAPKKQQTNVTSADPAAAAGTTTTTTAATKKRDDSRRAYHNEVERRRRDMINHWIERLNAIIQPADGQPPPELPPSVIGGEQQPEGERSKGAILSKACQYVMALHHKVNT